MTVVVSEEGFVVRVYGPPREHPPIHVHIEFGREAEAIIDLASESKEQRVRASYGMRGRDLRRASRLVQKYDAEIRAVWRRLHG